MKTPMIALFRVCVSFVLLLPVLGCQKSEPKPDQPAATPGQPEAAVSHPAYLDAEHGPKGPGWVALYGDDLSGWKSLPADRPNSWQVVDGVLTNKPGEHAGTNIYTEQRFGDFELYFEYRVPANNNSGVFLRGLYEMQIVDDHGLPVDQPKDWGNGGIWGTKAPARNVSKPAGEWQSAAVRMVGSEVTIILNGEKIIDAFPIPKPTHVYAGLDAKEGEPGPLLLQGDHGQIEFRHLMFRPLQAGVQG